MFKPWGMLLGFFGGLMKNLPILLVVVGLIFVVIKLQSCSGGLFNSKEALKEKIVAQRTAIDILEKANKDNTAATITNQKSNDVSLNTAIKDGKEQKQVYVNAGAVELQTKKKLAEVQAKYESSQKTLDDIRTKESESSDVQINSLWVEFCAASPSNNNCK